MGKFNGLWVTLTFSLVAGWASGQVPPGPQYHYYHFDQPVGITLDTSEVAVFIDRDAAVAGGALQLQKFGIGAADVQAHAIKGISMVKVPVGRATEGGLKTLVGEVAQEAAVSFVSPKFIDPRGLPLLVTRDLLIGFRVDVHPAQAEGLIAQMGLGQVLDRNWEGMRQVYRVRSASGDGFEVLRQANELAARADVVFAEPDIISTGVLHLIPNDPRFPQQWGLDNTGQSGGVVDMDLDGPQAWDISTGSSAVIVTIMDDGIQQDHPDINQLPGADFTGNNTGGDHANPCDRHGTSVGGCVAAMINNGMGGTGIAPNVKVMSTKVFVANVNPCTNFGSVQTSWVVGALSHAENVGARVTNTSLGYGTSSAISTKFASTRANGIVHFVSAGNDGTTTIGYPGNLPSVNAIAALNRSGNLASFSTSGPGLEFIAPGQSIWTTDRTGENGYTSDNEVEIDGTSFSSPLSAGVAALIMSVDSTQTPDEVEAIMRLTAKDRGTLGYDTTYGHGIPQAAAAMALASPSYRSCEEAVSVSCNSFAAFFNSQVDNPASPAFSCGNGSGHDGVLWLKFTATATSANVSTCGSDGPDSTFAVYQGDCGELVPLGCSEDGGCAGSGLGSQCISGLEIGETYYVQVGARTAAARGLYRVNIDCSCLGACCSLPPRDLCEELQEVECLAIDGSYGGPDSVCVGDLDGNGIDDGCDVLHSAFFQLPTANEESVESNWDLSDTSPARAVADDFTSEGRPVRGIRWWGREVGGGAAPDGWFIGFHEPLQALQPAEEPIGLYFCDSAVVTRSATSIEECASDAAFQYEAALIDCCLLQSNADGRSGQLPAVSQGFLAEMCVDYDLTVQAIVGRRFVDDGLGGCTEESTGTAATGTFWRWSTTLRDHGNHDALSAPSVLSGSDWLYGPWESTLLTCGSHHQAFEVLTTTPPGQFIDAMWDNEAPNGHNALSSQYGGVFTDFLTVDDFELPTGNTFNFIEFINEEDAQFLWTGRVRLEIYPDNGAAAPDESGGPTLAMWIPDGGGTVTRTLVGPGTIAERYRYRIENISVTLGPGVWWLGLASAGQSTVQGFAYWPTSHTTPPSSNFFYGGEAHLRSPSAGINNFVGWDTQLPGSSKYDVSFSLGFAEPADCNCNGVSDDEDIALLTSDDCNGNDVPDECERDCNGNGSPDDCDIIDLVSLDCQGNGIPDECDVLLGTFANVNGNEIPDVCECGVTTPLPEPSAVDKNRYLSFVSGNAGQNVAIRVRLVNVMGFGNFNGQVRWVGAPSACNECSGVSSFTRALLQCDPHFADWGAISLLDVYGPAVVPGSTYEVQVIHENCAVGLGDEPSYSPPLTLTTQKWGDVVSPFGGISQPNFGDIAAIVEGFRCVGSAPRKVRCQLQPNTPNPCGNLSFSDISADVNAFRGLLYPFTGPTTCP